MAQQDHGFVNRRPPVQSREPAQQYRFQESWRPIPGTPYEASDVGRVRRGDRVLTPHLSTYGYPTVRLSLGGIKGQRFVHRLVAMAFIGQPTRERWQINHKNGIKTDNRVSNLEWVTHRENAVHAWTVIRHTRTPNGGWSRCECGATLAMHRSDRGLSCSLAVAS